MRRKGLVLQGSSPEPCHGRTTVGEQTGENVGHRSFWSRGICGKPALVAVLWGFSMQSQDVFRRTLKRVAAEIDPWLQQLGDVAVVERDWAGETWRVYLKPRAAAACPLEILVHGSHQADIAIGGETFESVDLGALEALAPLIRAVTEGRVRHLSAVSAATGRPIGSALVVDLGDGHTLTLGADISSGQDVVRRERHFAPYRR